MVFSSIPFLFRFLPVFLILYFIVPKRMRNLILFLGSLFFYAWGEPIYVLLMLFSTVCDYSLGRAIEDAREKEKEKKARWFLVLSILINLSVLGFFKYADFLLGGLNDLFNTQIPLLNLPLPIGISFYTFQTMSYTIDVYRRETKAQKNILAFGVFVTMFPQLIAGPIIKYKIAEPDLLHRKIQPEAIEMGITRFIMGLGKKVLLANNIGLLWTSISTMNINDMSVVTAWIGILAFALQIYFDFSGYSDMAIGLGAILGFHFPENFNYPYISTSITEFWRRWHISLSSWFREYVYIPLGGNRGGKKKQLLNIIIVWALTGIWHGAGWNFLFWGLWFASFLIIEKLFFYKMLEKLPKVVGLLYMVLVVLVGWVFFAFDQLGQGLTYLGAMFGQAGQGWMDRNGLYQLSNYWLIFLILLLGCTPLPQKVFKKIPYVCALCLFLIFILSVAGIVEASYNPFLYFRF